MLKRFALNAKIVTELVTHHLASEGESNSVITPFVLYSVFPNFGLLWIIEKNNHHRFEIYLEDTQWIKLFAQN